MANTIVFSFVTSFLLCRYIEASVEKIYPCESKIYCQGPILEAMSRLNPFDGDSKDYVDRPLKKPADQILEDFLKKFSISSNISKHQLSAFINENFNESGGELIPHNPEDWKEHPEEFNAIADPQYKIWAQELNLIWKELCRKINPAAVENPELSSIISLPHEFVVPGGRFRESYYWDAYWILRGLLRSGMNNTAKSMIKNYLKLLKQYGFVPNGGRIYYLKRSQPPLLSFMFFDYYMQTKDTNFLQSNVQLLEQEISQFWKTNRSMEIVVNGEKHTVYRYNTQTNTPRPESHREDVGHAENFPEEDKAIFYNNIASAAESGWDFSSRWLMDGVTFRQQKTRLVLPVDLNAFICGSFKILAFLNQELKKTNKFYAFEKQFKECTHTMMTLFFNETSGVWFDYHLDTQKHNTNFYPSNLVPLFTGSYKFNDTSAAMRKIENYLKDSKATQYKGGIPTSLKRTGQQWDLPNGWAPLVHMFVEGLSATGDEALKNISFQVAKEWVAHNYVVFKNTSIMYEKYDVVDQKIAEGGEYVVQEGFGWTNGVIIDFLVKFGSQLQAPKGDATSHLHPGILRP